MFWARFEDLCTKSGKAPNAVAKELKIPSGSVTAWKKGSTPRNETLVRIATYFDVSVDYLSGSEQKEKPVAESDELDSDMLEIIEMLKGMTPAEMALVKERIRKIEESRG